MNDELKKRVLSSIILFPIVLFLIAKGSYYFSILLITSLLIALYEWRMMTKKKSYNILGYIFIICSFHSMYQIRMGNENSFIIFSIILSICILTDIGGYVFGKIFKGPKLTSYSPNKTYSGLIGSYILCFFLIPIFVYYNIINMKEILSFIIFTFLISSVSQIGDIVVSIFKRKSNITIHDNSYMI